MAAVEHGEAYFGFSFPTRDGAMPFPGWGEFEGPDSADLDDAAKRAIAPRSRSQERSLAE